MSETNTTYPVIVTKCDGLNNTLEVKIVAPDVAKDATSKNIAETEGKKYQVEFLPESLGGKSRPASDFEVGQQLTLTGSISPITSANGSPILRTKMIDSSPNTATKPSQKKPEKKQPSKVQKKPEIQDERSESEIEKTNEFIRMAEDAIKRDNLAMLWNTISLIETSEDDGSLSDKSIVEISTAIEKAGSVSFYSLDSSGESNVSYEKNILESDFKVSVTAMSYEIALAIEEFEKDEESFLDPRSALLLTIMKDIGLNEKAMPEFYSDVISNIKMLESQTDSRQVQPFINLSGLLSKASEDHRQEFLATLLDNLKKSPLHITSVDEAQFVASEMSSVINELNIYADTIEIAKALPEIGTKVETLENLYSQMSETQTFTVKIEGKEKELTVSKLTEHQQETNQVLIKSLEDQILPHINPRRLDELKNNTLKADVIKASRSDHRELYTRYVKFKYGAQSEDETASDYVDRFFKVSGSAKNKSIEYKNYIQTLEELHQEREPNFKLIAPVKARIQNYSNVYPLDAYLEEAFSEESPPAWRTALRNAKNISEVYRILQEHNVVKDPNKIADIEKYFKSIQPAHAMSRLGMIDNHFVSPPINDHLMQHIFLETKENDVTSAVPVLSTDETESYISELAARSKHLPKQEEFNFKDKIESQYIRSLLAIVKDAKAREVLQYIANDLAPDTRDADKNKRPITHTFSLEELDRAYKTIRETAIPLAHENRLPVPTIMKSISSVIEDSFSKYLFKDQIQIFNNTVIGANKKVDGDLIEQSANGVSIKIENPEFDIHSDSTNDNLKQFLDNFIANPNSPFFGQPRSEILALLANKKLSILGMDDKREDPREDAFSIKRMVFNKIREGLNAFPTDDIRLTKDKTIDSYRFAEMNFTDSNSSEVNLALSELEPNEIFAYYLTDNSRHDRGSSEDMMEKRIHHILSVDAQSFGQPPLKFPQETKKEQSSLSRIKEAKEFGIFLNPELEALITKDPQDWDLATLAEKAQYKDSPLSEEAIADFISQTSRILQPNQQKAAQERIDYASNLIFNVKNNILSETRNDYSRNLATKRARDIGLQLERKADADSERKEQYAEQKDRFNEDTDTYDYVKKMAAIDYTSANASRDLTSVFHKSIHLTADNDLRLIKHYALDAHPSVLSAVKASEWLAKGAMGHTRVGFDMVMADKPISMFGTILKDAVTSRASRLNRFMGITPSAQEARKEAIRPQVEATTKSLAEFYTKKNQIDTYKLSELGLIPHQEKIKEITERGSLGSINDALLLPLNKDPESLLKSIRDIPAPSDMLATAGKMPFFKKGVPSADAPGEIKDAYQKGVKEYKKTKKEYMKAVILSELKLAKEKNTPNIVAPDQYLRALTLLEDSAKGVFSSSEINHLIHELIGETPDYTMPSLEKLHRVKKKVEENLADRDHTYTAETNADLVSINVKSEKGYFVVRPIEEKDGSKEIEITTVSKTKSVSKDEAGEKVEFDLNDIPVTQIIELFRSSNGISTNKSDQLVWDPTSLFEGLVQRSINNQVHNTSHPEALKPTQVNLEGMSKKEIVEKMIKGLPRDFNEPDSVNYRWVKSSDDLTEQLAIALQVCDISFTEMESLINEVEEEQSSTAQLSEEQENEITDQVADEKGIALNKEYFEADNKQLEDIFNQSSKQPTEEEIEKITEEFNSKTSSELSADDVKYRLLLIDEKNEGGVFKKIAPNLLVAKKVKKVFEAQLEAAELSEAEHEFAIEILSHINSSKPNKEVLLSVASGEMLSLLKDGKHTIPAEYIKRIQSQQMVVENNFQKGNNQSM